MTGIAWDGVLLATDRASFCGDTKIESRKLHIYEYQGKHWMYASCGTNANTESIREWLTHRNGKPDFDFTNHEVGVSVGITVDSNGAAYYIYGNGALERIVGPWAADGAAGTFLSGVLCTGTAAHYAIALAVKLRGDCGIGCDVFNYRDLESFDCRLDFEKKANKSILKEERI